MAAPHKIWLVRHGETEWSKSGQHTGRTDIPLTAEGVEQARLASRHLAGRKFALVLTSPMGRARETCRLAGYADGAQVTEDLMEWNYGIYEGKTTAEIRVQQPGWSIWTSPIPEGETIEQVGARSGRLFERAEAAGGDVAFFAHGHILRITAACWMGLPPMAGRNLALGTAAVCVLGYERENRVIQVWNLEPHGPGGGHGH